MLGGDLFVGYTFCFLWVDILGPFCALFLLLCVGSMYGSFGLFLGRRMLGVLYADLFVLICCGFVCGFSLWGYCGGLFGLHYGICWRFAFGGSLCGSFWMDVLGSFDGSIFRFYLD